MLKVVEEIIIELVEKKDQVKLTPVENENDVTINVEVGEGDMGRVIGKGGTTINAIRTILKNCSCRDGKRYFIQIGDKRD